MNVPNFGTKKENIMKTYVIANLKGGVGAQERFERLIEGMKQAQGITEQLKAENALEWTGCLNNLVLSSDYRMYG